MSIGWGSMTAGQAPGCVVEVYRGGWSRSWLQPFRVLCALTFSCAFLRDSVLIIVSPQVPSEKVRASKRAKAANKTVNITAKAQ